MKPQLALAAAVTLLLTGCASSHTSTLNEMREMAQQAMERAQSAEAMAQQASAKADAASQDAAAAMEAARDAQACCQANTRRINRAFEQSMQK